MLSITRARLDVRKSSTDPGVDFTVPDEHVESAQLSRRIQRRKDEGTIVINNDDGRYAEPEHEITLGDRIDVLVEPQQSNTAWGDSVWGYGGWGGYRMVWSCFVEDVKYIRESATMSSVVIDGTDYVFGILSNRFTFDSFEDRPISGTDDAILETVLARECPEIDLQHVADVGAVTSIVAEGTNVLEFVISLARRGDAVLFGHRDKLVFDRLDSLPVEFEVDPTADIGTFSHEFAGDSVENVVRVDGGEDYALDDEQPTQDGYTTVTQSNRATFQVSTRKSQLARIEVWTRPTGSEESMTVRIQKDDGGVPVAPDDADSDIDSHQLSHHFLANDDFTTFLLNDHTLPEPNPWIIVETDGDAGQEVGIDTATGTPAYRAHYPFPITVRVRDSDSIDAYSRIEARLKQDSLETLDMAREMAIEHRDHFADPESELSFPAQSRRAHRLDPGEVVAFALPRERAEGDFIVTETEATFDGIRWRTNLKAAEASTI